MADGDTKSSGSVNVSGLSTTFNKLQGRSNYLEWKFVMRNALILENLWICIDGYAEDDRTSPDEKKRLDSRALAKICLSVNRCCFPHIMKTCTASEAWDALERAFEDIGLNSRLRLLRNLCSIKLEDFSNMEKYVNEYIALSEATKEAVYCRALLAELLGRSDIVVINIDNQSAARLASKLSVP